MEDKELELLLAETLESSADAPPYLDVRLRQELAQARATPKGISLWWLPLVLSLGTGAATCLWSLLLPWPLSALLGLGAILAVTAAACFTAIGLWRFDLKEKGRVY